MAHGILLGDPPVSHQISPRFWFPNGDVLLSCPDSTQRRLFRVHQNRIFSAHAQNSTSSPSSQHFLDLPYELLEIALQAVYEPNESPSYTLDVLDQLLVFCAQHKMTPVRSHIVSRFESQIGVTLLRWDFHDMQLEIQRKAAARSPTTNRGGGFVTREPVAAIALARRHRIHSVLPTFYYDLFRARPEDRSVDWANVTIEDTQIIAEYELFHNSVIASLRSPAGKCLREGHKHCTSLRTQIFQKIATIAESTGDLLRPLRYYASGETVRRNRVCPPCVVDTCHELHRRRYAVWTTLVKIVLAS